MFNHRTHGKEVRPAVHFSQELLETTDFLDQPSVFWTRKAWEMVGPLDESLHYSFDSNGSFVPAEFAGSWPSKGFAFTVPDSRGAQIGDRRQETLDRTSGRGTPAFPAGCGETLRVSGAKRRRALVVEQANARISGAQRSMVPKLLLRPPRTLLSPPFWHLPAGIQEAFCGKFPVSVE